jgi:hypothetical protein
MYSGPCYLSVAMLVCYSQVSLPVDSQLDSQYFQMSASQHTRSAARLKGPEAGSAITVCLLRVSRIKRHAMLYW